MIAHKPKLISGRYNYFWGYIIINNNLYTKKWTIAIYPTLPYECFVRTFLSDLVRLYEIQHEISIIGNGHMAIRRFAGVFEIYRFGMYLYGYIIYTLHKMDI